MIVFLLLFIFPTCAFELWGDHFDQTNFEKREPAEKPVFSIDTIEEYPRAYEAYFNDSLPFRNQLITANSLLNLRLFQISAVDYVLFGKDKWMFYNPVALENDDPMGDYYGSNLFTPEELDAMASNLIAARDSLNEQGKEFVVMIAPNKVCMYGDAFLPDDMQRENTYTTADQVFDYLSAHTDLTVVYPKQQLFSAMEQYPDYPFYYKTDTHWNNLGGYIGTQMLLEQVGIATPPIEEYNVVITEKYAGDLAIPLGLQACMKHDNMYVLDDYRKDQIVNESLNYEGSVKVTCSSTTNADERAFFMIQDSFAAAMIPYLNKQFNTCSFAHIDKFTPDLLQKYPSDIVVVEVVERFVWKLMDFKVE